MERLISSEIDKAKGRYIRVLEIGSYAGGSATIWANAIRLKNNSNGLVACIDPWQTFDAFSQESRTVSQRITDAAQNRDKVLRLFQHNVRASLNSEIIKPFRGLCSQLVPLFSPDTFDFIYIDGQHSYQNVLQDLQNCSQVLKDGGILCGDDLELQEHEVDAENAKRLCDRDMIFDPKTGLEFHPGTCLAVAEFFGGMVSCYDGFWVMRKHPDGWTSCSIPL